MCFKLITIYISKKKQLPCDLTFISQQWLWKIQKSFWIKNLFHRNQVKAQLTTLRYLKQKFTFYYKVQHLIKHNINTFDILRLYCKLFFSGNYRLYTTLNFLPFTHPTLLLKLPLFFSFNLY